MLRAAARALDENFQSVCQGRLVSPAAAGWSARILQGSVGAKGASAKASQQCVGQTVFGTLLAGTTSTFHPSRNCLCVREERGGHGRRHQAQGLYKDDCLGRVFRLNTQLQRFKPSNESEDRLEDRNTLDTVRASTMSGSRNRDDDADHGQRRLWRWCNDDNHQSWESEMPAAYRHPAPQYPCLSAEEAASRADDHGRKLHELKWLYLDSVGQEFGPLSSGTMQEWLTMGRFPVGLDLRVRLPERLKTCCIVKSKQRRLRREEGMHVALCALAIACDAARDPSEQSRLREAPWALLETGDSVWTRHVQADVEKARLGHSGRGTETRLSEDDPEQEADSDGLDEDEEDEDGAEGVKRYQDLPDLSEEPFNKYNALAADDGPVASAITAAETAAAVVKESAVVWKMTEEDLQEAAGDVNAATKKSEEDVAKGDRVLYDLKAKPGREVKKEVEENLARMQQESGDMHLGINRLFVQLSCRVVEMANDDAKLKAVKAFCLWDQHLPLRQIFPDLSAAFRLPPAWPEVDAFASHGCTDS
ncbi:unnamed protein product [Symbiodinium necroappetens]|uniref:GYF domain-containing protein n=1 Tax=Symbiodinium necroappetens TaxID=1628268 RepID=A0A812ZZ90_9DINO|nr:unnamed protein product [Symbiodinium necroappetens]